VKAFCESCGETVKWIFVGEYTDSRGRTWELYRCPECDAECAYCVG
jgi:hypothetical protein